MTTEPPNNAIQPIDDLIDMEVINLLNAIARYNKRHSTYLNLSCTPGIDMAIAYECTNGVYTYFQGRVGDAMVDLTYDINTDNIPIP